MHQLRRAARQPPEADVLQKRGVPEEAKKREGANVANKT